MIIGLDTEKDIRKHIVMEFATESDMIEWLKENGYEYDDETDV